MERDFVDAARVAALVAGAIALVGLAGTLGTNWQEASLYAPWADTQTGQAHVVGYETHHVAGSHGGHQEYTLKLSCEAPPDRLDRTPVMLEREVDEDYYFAAIRGTPVWLRYPKGHPEGGFPLGNSLLRTEFWISLLAGAVTFVGMFLTGVIPGRPEVAQR